MKINSTNHVYSNIHEMLQKKKGFLQEVVKGIRDCQQSKNYSFNP
jgi:hypothetical protein